MLWAALGLLVAYWLIAILVLAIDPFDVYPWGWRTRLPEVDTTDDSKFLVAVAAKDPAIDLVMIGSSVSDSYTPEQIQGVFPSVHDAWNMSYPAASPADRALTVDTFLKYSHAKRFIIWIDWTYTLPPTKQRDNFPAYLYDSSYANDLQMVNQEALSAIWDLLRGPGAFWKIKLLEEQRSTLDAANFKAFQTPDAMRNLELLIRANRRPLSGAWRFPCSRYPALDLQLLPELRRFSQRHISVDLVFPAYSPAAYYVADFRGKEAMLPDQLNLRRCVVAISSGIPGVAVWAPDADVGATSDLANYKDSTHLYARSALITTLSRIGDPAFRIDSTNVESYLGRLRATVLNYDVKNSSVKLGRPDGS